MEHKLKLGDLYASTFLDINNDPPDLEVVRGKTLFVFPATDRTYQLLNMYNDGSGQCSALEFVEHMKNLRARMLHAKNIGGAR